MLATNLIRAYGDTMGGLGPEMALFSPLPDASAGMGAVAEPWPLAEGADVVAAREAVAAVGRELWGTTDEDNFNDCLGDLIERGPWPSVVPLLNHLWAPFATTNQGVVFQRIGEHAAQVFGQEHVAPARAPGDPPRGHQGSGARASAHGPHQDHLLLRDQPARRAHLIPSQMPPMRDPFDALTAPRTSSVQRVLSVVEAIPSGKVMSYGDVAALLGMGPREVARVMATQGDEVAWWRVLRADGSCAPHLATKQLKLLRAEGVALRSKGRVDMSLARVTEVEP